MTGIILAGGKSTRFGSDKSFMKINGQPLLKKQIALFKKNSRKSLLSPTIPDINTETLKRLKISSQVAVLWAGYIRDW